MGYPLYILHTLILALPATLATIVAARTVQLLLLLSSQLTTVLLLATLLSRGRAQQKLIVCVKRPGPKQ